MIIISDVENDHFSKYIFKEEIVFFFKKKKKNWKPIELTATEPKSTSSVYIEILIQKLTFS